MVFSPPNVEKPVTERELNVGSVTSNSVPSISISSTLSFSNVNEVPIPTLNTRPFVVTVPATEILPAPRSSSSILPPTNKSFSTLKFW